MSVSGTPVTQSVAGLGAAERDAVRETGRKGKQDKSTPGKSTPKDVVELVVSPEALDPAKRAPADGDHQQAPRRKQPPKPPQPPAAKPDSPSLDLQG